MYIMLEDSTFETMSILLSLDKILSMKVYTSQSIIYLFCFSINHVLLLSFLKVLFIIVLFIFVYLFLSQY